MYDATFLKRQLPYCIEWLEGGWCILLNRDYKPLGGDPKVLYDYNTHASKCRIKGLSPATAKRLDVEQRSIQCRPGDRAYLYNDGCNPACSKQFLEQYSAKLNKLIKLPMAFAPTSVQPGNPVTPKSRRPIWPALDAQLVGNQSDGGG